MEKVYHRKNIQMQTYINLILIYKRCVLEKNERFITTNWLCSDIFIKLNFFII